MEESETQAQISIEEKDNMLRSKKKIQEAPNGTRVGKSTREVMTKDMEGRIKHSFRGLVHGGIRDKLMQEGCWDKQAEESDDHAMGDEEEDSWVMIGMTKEEKR